MKTMNIGNLSLAICAAVGFAAFATPGTSQAATIASKWKSNAAGVCQSAFSSGAGAVIRARPLAVQNEGAANAFVTCSLPYNDDADEQPSINLGVRFINNNAAPVNVSCTLVSGTTFDGADYVTKGISVPAGSTGAIIAFFPSDLPGAPDTIFAPNVSCSLSPGLGIQYLYYFYDRQIGV